ncbi:EamA-like transporter family protein [Stella humosa]|uniref:EamA-like transporter family protein n=1 Tax=Stella humosa TaxID=94 RepID=A0A3N1MBY2_9PROT|nr:DMT family transporter [Stella humosa]ROQ00217.1 EamA-like transporter family protein [Stella humosa]BBK30548.1 membrane protein [Stella humosa]
MSQGAAAPAKGAVGTTEAVALLVLAVVLFGTAWPAMKNGLADATPVWYAAARAAVSAIAALAMVVVLGRAALPARADWPIILSVGTGQLAGFFTLANLGLGYVPASRAVVLAYTTTIWLVPIGTLFLGERLGAWRLAGLVSGIAGVAVLFNPAALDWSDGRVLLGNLFLLAAALSWSLAIVHARVHRWHLSPLQVLPWQMAWAALLLTVVAMVAEPDGHVGWSATALVPLAYVAIIVGPTGTWATTTVSRALPTIVTSLGFLAAPAVGVVASTVALGEPVTLSLALGAGLVIGGAVLVSLSTLRPGAAR